MHPTGIGPMRTAIAHWRTDVDGILQSSVTGQHQHHCMSKVVLRAGDWSRALVLSDVLLRDASLRNGPYDPGTGALQRGLASCLQRMGCTDLLQTYWRGVPGRNEGETSGKLPVPCLVRQASRVLPEALHRCQARQRVCK